MFKLSNLVFCSSLLGFLLVTNSATIAHNVEQPTQNQPTTELSTDNPSLFVNLTSNDPWRAGMAINFAQNSLNKGHEVVIYLNIQGVNLASTKIAQPINSHNGQNLQQMLKDFISQGGRVIICPSCMEQAGVSQEDLIEGVEMSSPDVIETTLYRDQVRVMSW